MLIFHSILYVYQRIQRLSQPKNIQLALENQGGRLVKSQIGSLGRQRWLSIKTNGTSQGLRIQVFTVKGILVFHLPSGNLT
jgi:hypothetical protein